MDPIMFYVRLLLINAPNNVFFFMSDANIGQNFKTLFLDMISTGIKFWDYTGS